MFDFLRELVAEVPDTVPAGGAGDEDEERGQKRRRRGAGAKEAGGIATGSGAASSASLLGSSSEYLPGMEAGGVPSGMTTPVDAVAHSAPASEPQPTSPVRQKVNIHDLLS